MINKVSKNFSRKMLNSIYLLSASSFFNINVYKHNAANDVIRPTAHLYL
jgi:hypothetical protein